MMIEKDLHFPLGHMDTWPIMIEKIASLSLRTHGHMDTWLMMIEKDLYFPLGHMDTWTHGQS